MSSGDHAPSGPSRAFRHAVFAAWRSRLARVGAALFVAIAVGLTMFGMDIWRQMNHSTECPEVRWVDLDVDDIVILKDRLQVYRLDPDPDAELTLDGNEATFLLRDLLPYDIDLVVDGEHVTAVVVRELEEEGCRAILFEGTLEVDDGTVRLEPDRLRVGDAELAGLLGPFSVRVSSSRLADEDAAELLANIQHLRVADGALHIRFDDRWSLW